MHVATAGSEGMRVVMTGWQRMSMTTASSEGAAGEFARLSSPYCTVL